ncbi:rhomboid family intramembrane serine protease [Halapricum hydrolyticum]|uniref:Rhomboid family intramembrane serine protease n=1 Tax=Halapricum hydrolyticum TaxID=2979991 RepID=A0AAE3ICN0_9EURY|nr:rhomboid family intramembrane serine protease [Halapricum hydrolyticum]MCU4718815.1 rhomboid family intramembrane serine protease [Halapricum hydrolyticum]MCU4727777.1 rhomboid family intramembrane serine protease [Halapricum hydrolyticum]
MDEPSSPTLTLAVLAVVVGVAQVLLAVVGVDPWTLALAWPLADRPWTLLTSVFAHSGPGHLLSNLLGLLLVGLFLERRTSPARFYAFFLLAGVVAGVTEVTVAALVFGHRAAVLGASGAVFALFGYVLGGNRLTEFVAGGITISPVVQLAVLVVLAGGLTLATAGPRTALIAHFTGLVVGFLAGRRHLLRSSIRASPNRRFQG